MIRVHQLVALLAFFVGISVSRAEMRVVTVAAIVKAFDESTVMVQIDRRQLTIPRNQVNQKELRVGTAIFLTFRGEQIERLFRTLALNPTNRRPASSKGSPGHKAY